MRTILCIACLCCYMHAYTQTYEIKKGISETYRIEDYGEDDVTVVYNMNNPFNLSDYNSLWREKVKIPNYTIDPGVFVKRYILPAVQNLSMDEDDIFLMRIYISLDGKIGFIKYIYPSAMKIPIETLEKMEKAMKSESSFVLKYDPAKMGDTPYIMFDPFYALTEMLKYWTPPKPPKVFPEIDRELEPIKLSDEFGEESGCF